jgi:multiple sugar transport system permease protein
MTFALPLAIWTLAAFFRRSRSTSEQAAQVDGATPYQAFRKVILPLALPGVFTSAIIVFIFCWNDFLFAISLTSTQAPGPSRRRRPSSPPAATSSTRPVRSRRPRSS